jgi:hypothetical protein
MLVLDYTLKILTVINALHTDPIELWFQLWEASIEIGPVFYHSLYNKQYNQV